MSSCSLKAYHVISDQEVNMGYFFTGHAVIPAVHKYSETPKRRILTFFEEMKPEKAGLVDQRGETAKLSIEELRAWDVSLKNQGFNGFQDISDLEDLEYPDELIRMKAKV